MGKINFYSLSFVLITALYVPLSFAMRVKYINLGSTKILWCVESDETGSTNVTLQKMGEGENARYSGDKVRSEIYGGSREVILESSEAEELWNSFLLKVTQEGD